jgi:hypothetical protein
MIANLDAMSQDELRAFANTVESRRIPLREARLLLCYAGIKATAMDSRLAGRIQEALNLEDTCDRLYSLIEPEWRW